MELSRQRHTRAPLNRMRWQIRCSSNSPVTDGYCPHPTYSTRSHYGIDPYSYPMNITLRQLYGFKTVADVGTFTAAAQRLKVTQPTLSLNIRDLETELGARLFDRTTRRVELTAAGREFLQSVDKLIVDLEHAVQNTRDLADRKRGRLVVAAPPLLAALVVPAAMADFKKRFASIDVSVIDVQTNIIVEKVRSG